MSYIDSSEKRHNPPSGGFRRLDSVSSDIGTDAGDIEPIYGSHPEPDFRSSSGHAYNSSRNVNQRSRHKKVTGKRILGIPFLYLTFPAIILAAVIIICVSVRITAGNKHSSSDSSSQQELTENDPAPSYETYGSGDTATLSETTDEVQEDAPDEQQEDQTQEEKGILASSISFYDGYETHRSVSTRYISNEKVISDAAVLIDADSGDIIADRNAYASISPASMTKILTVLVAAEHINEDQLDDTFEITREITDYTYKNDLSAVGFQVGDTPTVRDLFYGTILPSGADAGLALAEYVSGTQEEFVKLMNERLSDLGLSGTAHFTNCVGLYDEDHFCTLTDMAMILKAAVENDFCREILSAHIYTTSPTIEHPEGIEISNWFLRRIEDKDTHGEVICAKTGFVKESGCCAASYARSNDGHRYFLVTSNAWSSWRCIYDQVEIYSAYLE